MPERLLSASFARILMTFDLTPEQQSLVTRVRVAASAEPSATSLRSLLEPGALPTALLVEEVSLVNAGLGAQLGFGALGGADTGTMLAMPGLLGSEAALAAVSVANHDRARLVAAAVALGVGRAAVAHALAAMKAAGVRPGADERAPHWVLANAATELEAARLLTYAAALAIDHSVAEAGTLVSRAKAFAAQAAEQAVDAAIRIEGPGGYVRGGVLERLNRDANTLSVILP